MKENIQEFYRKHESFDRYMMDNVKRVSEINRLYLSNKKYFGKRVLDLTCGGGILGFLLEPKRHIYTGLDINSDMIAGAKKYADKVKSKNKFIKLDILKKKINGDFDTVVCIGNSLGHFTTHEFLNILGNIPKSRYFILDYRDVVTIFFNKEWRDKMIEKDRGKRIVSLTKKFDEIKGTIEKISYEEGKKDKTYFTHTVWSPFIIEPIMKSNGWDLIKRKRIKTWQGWLEVYKRK